MRITCKECGIEKPCEEFSKAPSNKSGYNLRCKPCWSKRYNSRSRKKEDIDGSLKKDKFSRDSLIDQVNLLIGGSKTGFDYSFLNTINKPKENESI